MRFSCIGLYRYFEFCCGVREANFSLSSTALLGPHSPLTNTAFEDCIWSGTGAVESHVALVMQGDNLYEDLSVAARRQETRHTVMVQYIYKWNKILDLLYWGRISAHGLLQPISIPCAAMRHSTFAIEAIRYRTHEELVMEIDDRNSSSTFRL